MKSAAPRASLARHYSRYAIGNVLSLAAGFVSFPITTRLLSNSEFGVMGYWEVWVLMLAAVLKLGAGETIMRFYPHGKPKDEQIAYGTNIVLVPSLLALGGWLVLMMGLGVGALAGWIEHPLVAGLAFGTLLMQIWSSHLSWIMATRELSGLNATVNVVWRWATVIATLLVLSLLLPTAAGVFAARLVVGLALLAWSIRWVMGTVEARWSAVNWVQAREGLAYGIPLALKEMSNIVLVLINRVMLKWMGGDYTVVGVYTIGFSLAMYVDQIVSTALSQALNPVATRLYATEGAAAVVRLKRQVLPWLVYACVGLAAGVLVCGHDFILVVASADKLGSAPVFIVAGVCLLLQPIINTAGMGLLLVKRSRAVFGLTAGAAVFNIGLNYLMIPQWGMMGAVYSVCASQIALQCAFYVACPTELRCLPSARSVLTALAFAGMIVALCKVTDLYGLHSPWLRLTAAAVTLVVAYVIPVLILDESARRIVLERWRRRRAGS